MYVVPPTLLGTAIPSDLQESAAGCYGGFTYLASKLFFDVVPLRLLPAASEPEPEPEPKHPQNPLMVELEINCFIGRENTEDGYQVPSFIPLGLGNGLLAFV